MWSNCFFELFLGYETQKVVQIRSKPIGIIFRLLQLTIFIYIVLWVMWWEKGYQAFDSVTSGTSVRVFGNPFLNSRHDNDTSNMVKSRVWDIPDIIVPPQQNSGFFITTNVIITPNQTQSFCAEADSLKISHCVNDSQCPKGLMLNSMHGPFTGKCLFNVGRCEIFGWCPVEEDLIKMRSPFYEILNYTVLISNTIKFRQYGIKRQNILPHMTQDYLSKCLYNHNGDSLCPVFKISDIFGGSKSNNDHILQNGGIIAISIDWTCDFDKDIKYCIPKYSFSRLYNDHEEDEYDDEGFNSGLASGWNIYYSNQYENSGVKHRILTKAIGVQFFIHTTGKGGKFDLATFTMNCGSGLALFGGATFFCDMILLYFLKKRKFYRKAKCDILDSSSE